MIKYDEMYKPRNGSYKLMTAYDDSGLKSQRIERDYKEMTIKN